MRFSVASFLTVITNASGPVDCTDSQCKDDTVVDWDDRWQPQLRDDKNPKDRGNWRWEAASVNEKGSLIAFGDFTNNGKVDALSLSQIDGQPALKLHIYDHGTNTVPFFRNFKDGADHFPLVRGEKGQVASIVPIDMDMDGSLDLLVVWKKYNKAIAITVYTYEVLVQAPTDDNSLWFTLSWTSGDAHLFLFEPLVVDMNMDGVPDLLTADGEGIKLLFATGDPENPGFQEVVRWEKYFDIELKAMSKYALAKNHASAIVDIDGDCSPDIALEMEGVNNNRMMYFSSYSVHENATSGNENLYDTVPSESSNEAINNVTTRWKPLSAYPGKAGKDKPLSLDHDLPAKAGHPTFVDLNSDGAIDLIFPVFDERENMDIHAILNKQMALCKNPIWSQPGCRLSKDFCRICPDEICDEVSLLEEIVIYKAAKDQVPFNKDKELGTWLRMGDFNNDMYPDVIVNSEKEVMLLLNKPEEDDTKKNNDVKRISLHLYTAPYKAVKDASFTASTFFIQESKRGWNDILIQQEDGLIMSFDWRERDENGSSLYHLTTDGVSGVCNPRPNASGECLPVRKSVLAAQREDEVLVDNEEAANGHKKGGYGQSYPGIVIKIAVIDFRGFNIARVETQLAQQTHRSLGKPYVHFGLFHCNNYLAEFWAGLTVPPPAKCLLRGENKFNRLHCPMYYSFANHGYQVIPNTSVRLIPSPRTENSLWMLELAVMPSETMALIFLGACIVLLVLGFLIMFLEYRERKKQERRQYRDFRVHFINA